VPKPTTQQDSNKTMQCMEVWGGNTASDDTVAIPGLDAWVFSRPYAGDDGGGDVHYLSSCATGRITRLLVADVSGHGASVSEIALKLRNLMRRYINFVDQTRLIRSMNAEFAQLAQLGRFATAVVATYWAPTNQLVVCNAGHPRPAWYRQSRGTWEILKAPAATSKPAPGEGRGGSTEGVEATFVNLPLGVADLTGYDQFGVELSPGDLILFYTDSMTEARNPETGRQLGEDGLIAILASLDAAHPATLIPQLIQHVVAYGGDADPEDDLTVFLLRHTGSQVQSPFVKGLLAPFRIAASATRRLLGGATPAGLPQISLPTIAGAFVPALGRRWRPGR